MLTISRKVLTSFEEPSMWAGWLGSSGVERDLANH